MRLVINDYEIDLFEKTRIRQTKQINDIADIKTRQTNFTRSFDLPKTANNIKAFNFLSLVGDQSNIPYEKNEAYLFGDSGELFIYKGWSVIKDTSNVYKCYIYDGIVDFYKSIENKTLTDTGLSDLNHLKNLANVIATWNDLTLPYRYNVADYNGKAIYNDGVDNRLNLDYLIPSASVLYLWNKIFEYIGWTYEGSIFELETFKNLWMTYPKTIGDDTQVTEHIHTWEFNGAPNYYAGPIGPYGSPVYRYSNLFTHNPILNDEYASSSPSASEGPPAGVSITVVNSGLYKFTLDGSFGMQAGSGYTGNFDVVVNRYIDGATVTDVIIEDVSPFQEIDVVYYITMEAGQSFALHPSVTGTPFQIIGTQKVVGDLDIDFELVTGSSVDFEEAFIGMSIKDFINEILVRYSLTAFPDNKNKNIVFLTHEELIQTNEVDDWSDKFVNRINEEYIIGSYGRKNTFSYKYNDKDANYNDGFLQINNINLKDEASAFNSNIYSPEKDKFYMFETYFNTYKFWNKENKDDGTVKYKPLENRFYFMKSEIVTYTIKIGSEVLVEVDEVTSYPKESFSGMRFNEIVNQYYPTMYAVLNKSKLMKFVLNLTGLDVENMDFKKLVYIEQEASYFQKNKISNFESRKLTSVELIRLDISANVEEILNTPPKIVINSTIIESTPAYINSDYAFLDYIPLNTGINIIATKYTNHPVFGGTSTSSIFTESIDIGLTNHVFNIFSDPYIETETGWYEVYIEDTNFGTSLFSNKIYVFYATPASAIPSINIGFEPIGIVYNQAHNRDVYYTFNNFTPTSAVLTIQAHDFLNNISLGPITTVTISTFTQDVQHTLSNVLIPASFGFYKVRLITNSTSFEQVLITY